MTFLESTYRFLSQVVEIVERKKIYFVYFDSLLHTAILPN